MSSSDFAQNHLSKHGWEKGQGLGKQNHGIKEAIKVKVKNNKGGLGLDHASDFTFHWWDHIFNKAANSIEVTSDGDDVKLKKVKNPKKVEPLLISNKRPLRNSYQGKPLVYGCFVKAGSFNPSDSKTDINIERSLTSSDEESSDDGEDKYFGSNTLDKTFQMTGLTGHKAARHGHKMNGKLKRIQDQENATSTVIDDLNEIKKIDRKKSVKAENIKSAKHESDSLIKEEKKKKKKKKNETEQILQVDECKISKKKKKKSGRFQICEKIVKKKKNN